MILPANSFYNRNDFPLKLITEEQLNDLPLGTALVCINGKNVIVGVDRIDLDTRDGFLAYGFKLSTGG